MQRLSKLLNELHPDIDIKGDTRLIGDGILNSLDMVTLVTDINETYGVDIGAEHITPENFDKIGDILSLIERQGGEICR